MFDTNIFITAWWHTYPSDIFPTLWTQLSQNSKQITILQPIFTELKKKADAVCNWIEAQPFQVEPITIEMNQKALDMEARYQTGKSPRGADSVDIQLIAWAKITGNTVVTFESQLNIPDKVYNYKIPTICKREQVNCILFVDLLRDLRISI